MEETHHHEIIEDIESIDNEESVSNLMSDFYINEEEDDYYQLEASCRNRNNKNRSKTIKVSSKKSKHKEQIETEKQLKMNQEIRHCVDKILKTVRICDIPRFTRLFAQYIELTGTKNDEINDLLNKPVDDNGNTLLHLAAEFKQREFVSFLIIKNADVSITNSKGLTPYQCTDDIETKRVFFDLINESRKTYPKPTMVPDNLKEFQKNTNTYNYGPDERKFEPQYQSGYKYWLALWRLRIIRQERSWYPLCNGCWSNVPKKSMPLFRVYCSSECMNAKIDYYDNMRKTEQYIKDYERKNNVKMCFGVPHPRSNSKRQRKAKYLDSSNN